ncbi:anthranilate synthase component I family protein [Thermosyntropha sp.]|uniref:anthranilate synthase component I family protein n=1 Tax=Thermosyntropha sp. TaxID=2740820 RepID=UPI0025E758F6|nr:anthranilate synthase component I family protein [Thermosyntropha sp.]MBO8158772.1 anthranilate synthase component I family protein [Thermosyntropha sp.]
MSRDGNFTASMSVHAGFYLPLSGVKAAFSPDEIRNLFEIYDYVPVYASTEVKNFSLLSFYESLNPSPPSCLLESMSGRDNNRFSVLAFHDMHILNPSLKKRCGIRIIRNFLNSIKVFSPDFPFFCGGIIGYFSYESGLFMQELEPVSLDGKEGYFFMPGKVVVHDRYENRVTVFLWLKSVHEVEKVYEELDYLLFSILSSREESTELGKPVLKERDLSEFESDIDKESFCQMVEKAKKYINTGDIFQVVLSRRLYKKSTAPPIEVYKRLRQINPSPYMFYLNLPHGVLLGASPEMMVKVENGVLRTRPIAGTRKVTHQGGTKEEYLLLLEDEKERAEHLMLVDLSRNDVGKVSLPGTVKVKEFFYPEIYSHVMHIVSTVEGVLKPGIDVIEAFAACFPAGTLTGAPKKRAMEIISELEGANRGFYGGSVGYIGFNQILDSCITIRAMWYKDGIYLLQSGAGIVEGSVPEKEYEETINKAKALIEAIKGAEEEG